MCIITTSISSAVMGAISVVTALASTAVSVYSSIQQGKAQKAQYEYQAEVDKQNAKIADDNAKQVKQEGIEESRLQRLKTQQKIASQTSAMAANGIDVTQGTAVNLLGDTAMWGEMDALTTRANYDSRAYSLNNQATDLRNQAKLDTLAGQNAYKAGQLNALSNGLSGISKTMDVASKWYNLGSNTKTAADETNPTGIKVKKSMQDKWAIAGMGA